MEQQYDYIIAGAGAAGLSLAWKLMQSPLSTKQVLIVDNNLHAKYDKTWCFWDSNAPPFSDVIHKKWSQVEVRVPGNRFTQPLNQYPYYCIRSNDFQEKIIEAIRSHPTFDLLEGNITDLFSDEGNAILQTKGHSIKAEYIFQSCFNPWEGKADIPRYPLLQHFLGWEITVQKPLFDASTFTLMDFDATFQDGLAFIYVLPWSSRSGLIEYTIFSDELVSESLYKEKMALYLNNRYNLSPLDYQIQRREFGKIPMQDRPHLPWYKPRILNLGANGGITKPSTGYTFRRIQQQTDHILEGLLLEGIPNHQPPSERRFKAYDLWLLQIIQNHPQDALQVFKNLFQNNSMDDIFRFLGEESSVMQDLKIMSSVPYLPFLRAIWKSLDRFIEI